MNDEHVAQEIVEAASRRALGSRPRLRVAAAIGWSAFIGATSALPFWLLVEHGGETPLGMDRLALLFAIAYGLALVPAIATAILLLGGERP